ncbi:PREDICTED: UPF0602 protein C4orf47-like [Nicrophorus vespilloides]|uniref:UPF0602 protein C4orf47-like n=1 Tax=Nicrophorus vespilloides TaxID=110193 RepID=A0ABM1NDG3_NICVS|nr:PREDICTED: UPF0602 protein C4orf47-like [Nicrophorus vespilloides]
MYTSIYPDAYFTKNPFIDPERMRPGPVYVERKQKKVKYSNDTFIPTGPAKWPGGCHDGCFDPFPEWKRCKYVSMLQANKPFIGDKGTFYPQSKGKKTLFTRSVLQYNTDLNVNSQNYKKAVPTYTKYLLNC